MEKNNEIILNTVKQLPYQRNQNSTRRKQKTKPQGTKWPGW